MAISLVVLLHVSKRAVDAGSATWWLDLCDLLQTMRMPLFFTVAGVFAASWVSSTRSWSSLLRSKVLLFAWVYAVWVLVRFVWVVVIPPARDPVPLSELALRILWPDGPGWFVVALAVVFVLARAVDGLPRGPVVAVACVTSVVFLAGWVHVDNLVWDGVGTYTAFFLLGVVLRRHALEVGERIPGWALTAVPLAWAGLYVALAAADLESAPVMAFLLRLAGVAAGVCLALLLQDSAALRALGRGTLPVYMAHQMLVVSAVAWLSAAVAFDRHALLAVGAPLLITALLVPATFALGRVAPRWGLGWLFATPAWLERLAGAPQPAPRPEPAASTV
jgi:uncharacterized membrane protein YcfT